MIIKKVKSKYNPAGSVANIERYKKEQHIPNGIRS
jgi:hypothetical protein